MPTPDLINATTSLSAVAPYATEPRRCMVRSQALSDLMYEEQHAQQLSERQRYHAAARYRLRMQTLNLENGNEGIGGRKKRALSMME